MEESLETRPQVHLHFIPTYSSWLNQVELWFSKIERDVIHRDIFTSVPNLARRIVTCIRRYNDAPTPIKWKYADPSRRIRVAQRSRVTVHQAWQPPHEDRASSTRFR